MSLKVILLTDYGSSFLPKEFKVDYSNPLWRFDKDLISQIERKNWVLLEGYSDVIDENTLYCQEIKDGMKYIYPIKDSMSNFNSFDIIDLDITRPWCIEEYDGSEYIKYLDDYKCISKELNYYTR